MHRVSICRLFLAALLLAMLGACGSIGRNSEAALPPPPGSSAASVGAAPVPTDVNCPDAPGPISGAIVFGQDNNLVAISPDGSAVQPITRVRDETFAYEPAWSPDGRTLAYTLSRPAADPDLNWLPIGIICGLDRASGAGRLLAHGGSALTSLNEASWSPDGGALIVTRHEAQLNEQRQYTADRYGLSRYDLVSGSLEPLVENATSGVLSPDGTRLAYLRIDPETIEVTLMVADGNATNAAAVPQPEFPLFLLFAPRWSPDGKELVVTASGGEPISDAPARRTLLELVLGIRVAQAHGPPTELWLSENQAAPDRLTTLELDDTRAAWSPDGMRIAFTNGDGGVSLLEVASGTTTQLTKEGNYGGVTWAP